MARIILFLAIFFTSILNSAVAKNLSKENIDDKVNYHADKADALRDDFIRNPKKLYEALKERPPGGNADILKNGDVAERLLQPAMAFFACTDTKFPAYAYYNVVQHVWVFFWIDEREDVVRARLSKGLVLEGRPQQNAWFELFDEKTSFLEAMQKAYRIQVDAFLLLFSEAACSEDISEIDYVFSETQATASLLLNEEEMGRFSSETIDFFQGATAKDYDLLTKEQIFLSLASKVDDSQDWDHITIQNLLPERTVIIIRAWKENGDKLELIEDSFKVLSLED